MSSRMPMTGFFLASAAALASADGAPHWFNRQISERIQVSGRRVLGYHMQRVEGDREAFKSLTYSGRGGQRFTNQGQINIGGKNVLGMFNFDITLTDDRYNDPETRRFSIDYKNGPLLINYGDIRGSLLNTNQFASFNRSLKGVSAGFHLGRLAVKALRSEAKGSASTVTLQGDNSMGPYYIGSGRIAQDSIEVRLDGREMRLLQDYTVNYESGTITFTNRIVPPTSTIVVAFESLGTGRGTGSIAGYGASYDMGKFGRVGFTSVEQEPTGRQGLSMRTDLFQGFGDPSVPYILTYEPLRTRPVVVKLQGVAQVEGAHYRFDSENPAVFYFLFHVPPNSNVDVSYTPKPLQTVDGARKVVGFDYQLKLGRQGSINYSQATGSLSNDVNPMRGTARGINATYALPGLNFRAAWRDVPNTFVGIESRGFLRNERSLDVGLDGSRGAWRYGLSNNNSLVGVRRTNQDGTYRFDNSRVTSSRGYLTYNPGQYMSWTLERNRSSNRTALGETRIETTALSGTVKRGRLQTSLGYDQTDGRGPMSLGTGAQRRSVSLDTLRLNTSYFAGKEWQLSARASTSRVDSAGKNGTGSDLSLSAAYKPDERLSVELNHALSSSGELATLSGFSSGAGLGYNGNGFSSAAPSSGFAPVGGVDYRSTSLAVSYRPSDRLSVAARMAETMASGSVSSNTSSRSLSLDVDWSLGKSHRTGFSFSQGGTRFLGSANRSDAKSLSFYVNGAPGSWSYRLAGHTLLSGGNSPFAQDSYGLDFALGHKIDARQRAGLSMHAGRTSGYLPQNSFDLGLFYEHQIWQNISLVSTYRWRQVRNLDPTVRAGAYRSQGLDIELAFDFVP